MITILVLLMLVTATINAMEPTNQETRRHTHTNYMPVGTNSQGDVLLKGNVGIKLLDDQTGDLVNSNEDINNKNVKIRNGVVWNLGNIQLGKFVDIAISDNGATALLLKDDSPKTEKFLASPFAVVLLSFGAPKDHGEYFSGGTKVCINNSGSYGLVAQEDASAINVQLLSLGGSSISCVQKFRFPLKQTGFVGDSYRINKYALNNAGTKGACTYSNSGWHNSITFDNHHVLTLLNFEKNNTVHIEQEVTDLKFLTSIINGLAVANKDNLEIINAETGRKLYRFDIDKYPQNLTSLTISANENWFVLHNRWKKRLDSSGEIALYQEVDSVLIVPNRLMQRVKMMKSLLQHAQSTKAYTDVIVQKK